MRIDNLVFMIWSFSLFVMFLGPCYFLLRSGIHHIFWACFLPVEYDKIYENMTLREKITLVIDTKHLKRNKQFHDDYGNFVLLKRIFVIIVSSATVLCAAALLLDWFVAFKVITIATVILAIPYYVFIFSRLVSFPGKSVWIYDVQRSRKTSKRK